MKKGILILFSVATLVALFAQDKLYIHKSDKSILGILVSAIDSMTFGSGETVLNIYNTDKSTTSLLVAAVDSITFGQETSDTVSVHFSETSATITNPLASAGVTVSQSGADVVITSVLDADIVKINVSGSSSNGSLKIYSNYRTELYLNGITLTNTDGPAINIQSGKRCQVTLIGDKTNTLSDGLLYATNTEDQKGTFFSEGQLVFNGTGTLAVTSLNRHAICSDDFIQVLSGNITVASAAKDAIHVNDYYRQDGGTVALSATSDGVETEKGNVVITGGTCKTIGTAISSKGINSFGRVLVTGGTIDMTVGGNQSKGIKGGGNIDLSGGTLTINTTGGATLSVLGSGYDPQYCTAIKSDSTINLSGSKITITASGISGKGISADGDLNMTSGTVSVTTSGTGATYTNSSGVTDSYASAGVEADGNITILGGTLTTVCSGSASKGISADKNLTIGSAQSAPVVNVTASGAKLLISGTANYTTAVYSTPKGIKSDGIMTINSGIFTISGTQQGVTAIDCDSIMNILGGTFTIGIDGNQSKGLKASRAMNISGGTLTITAKGAVVLENVAAATYDPSYCTAIKGDEAINISGGNITVTHSGAGGKGISSTTAVNITGGTVNITTSGAGTTYKNSLSATDAYSASCITADGSVNVNGGNVTLSSSGSGGKGISSDGTIIIGDATYSPTLKITTSGAKFVVSGTDYCHPKTIVALGAVILNNGTSTITSTDDGIHSENSITVNGGTHTISAVEGIESSSITFNGGITNVTATNDGLNGTYGTVSGGTESNDNSNIYIKGGIVIVAGSDAVDGNGNISVSGGTLIVNGPQSGMEEGFDFNGSFNINGGTVISFGSNSSMTKAMSTTSTQPGMYIKSSAVISSSTLFHIENSTGSEMITVKPKNGGYYIHYSSPSLTKGSTYNIYTGGTYTGGSYIGGTSNYGVYSGGSYSKTGATLKKSTTLSSSSTVNTITF